MKCKLAERTSSATEEIARMIADIKESPANRKKPWTRR